MIFKMLYEAFIHLLCYSMPSIAKWPLYIESNIINIEHESYLKRFVKYTFLNILAPIKTSVEDQDLFSRMVCDKYAHRWGAGNPLDPRNRWWGNPSRRDDTSTIAFTWFNENYPGFQAFLMETAHVDCTVDRTSHIIHENIHKDSLKYLNHCETLARSHVKVIKNIDCLNSYTFKNNRPDGITHILIHCLDKSLFEMKQTAITTLPQLPSADRLSFSKLEVSLEKLSLTSKEAAVDLTYYRKIYHPPYQKPYQHYYEYQHSTLAKEFLKKGWELAEIRQKNSFYPKYLRAKIISDFTRDVYLGHGTEICNVPSTFFKGLIWEEVCQPNSLISRNLENNFEMPSFQKKIQIYNPKDDFDNEPVSSNLQLEKRLKEKIFKQNYPFLSIFWKK